jgi:alkanesulfonate monooxygenase SsuD/methylene tetrahydromethanopterin reductase-like flavin-dependent oxidoreductase (luciferase family)
MSAGFKAQGTALQDYSKGRFVGTPQDCIDQIGKYTELGFSDFILIFPELDAFDMTGLQFFAEHVLPSFR